MKQGRTEQAAPAGNRYQLDAQDLSEYLQWGLESPLWEVRSPTPEEWKKHLLLGHITGILSQAAWHRFEPLDPSAELWNLSLMQRGTGLESVVLKYHRRFQR